MSRLLSRIRNKKALEEFPDNVTQNSITVPASYKFIEPDLPDWLKTYCSNPWTKFDTQAKSFCCKNNLIGKIPFYSYKQIQESSLIKKLKKDLLIGIKNSICDQCWNEEANGKKSMRQIVMEHKSEQELTEEISLNKIKHLVLHSGTTCNLACRTCSPYLSSTHIVEVKNRTIQWLEKNDSIENNKILKNLNEAEIYQPDYSQILEEDFSCLSTIEILGGEPLLNTEHFQVLEKIVKEGHARNCIITYITNGTKSISEKYLQILSNFKQVQFVVSIDAVDKPFEYIRTGASWSSVKDNINNIKEKTKLFPEVFFMIHPTISALNVMYLEELFEWIHEEKMHHYYDYVFVPEHYSFSLFDEQQRVGIEKKYSHTKFSHIINPILDIMKNVEYDPSLAKVFWSEIAWTEEYHNMKLADYLPRLTNLLQD